jgi:hypothetical protein
MTKDKVERSGRRYETKPSNERRDMYKRSTHRIKKNWEGFLIG